MARADRDTWAKRVERWKDSGLTAAEFAAEIGVTPSSLSWWKWQLGKSPSAPEKSTARRRKAKTVVPPMTFVEMTTPAQGEPIEIVFPSGVRVRVAADVDSKALGRVVDVLEGRR